MGRLGSTPFLKPDVGCLAVLLVEKMDWRVSWIGSQMLCNLVIGMFCSWEQCLPCVHKLQACWNVRPRQCFGMLQTDSLGGFGLVRLRWSVKV